MKSLKTTAVFLAMAVGVVATANAASILTTKKGMTLYTFDKDSAGVSNCYGGCAEKWPPYLVADGAKIKGAWGVIERKDGARQWTYNDKPLYTWIGDTKAGDKTGDGVKGVWHIVPKQAKKSYSYNSSSYQSNSYESDY